MDSGRLGDSGLGMRLTLVGRGPSAVCQIIQQFDPTGQLPPAQIKLAECSFASAVTKLGRAVRVIEDPIDLVGNAFRREEVDNEAILSIFHDLEHRRRVRADDCAPASQRLDEGP